MVGLKVPQMPAWFLGAKTLPDDPPNSNKSDLLTRAGRPMTAAWRSQARGWRLQRATRPPSRCSSAAAVPGPSVKHRIRFLQPEHRFWSRHAHCSCIAG